MTKTTVRDSEEAMNYIDGLVEEDVFENKSDFYRFARDYALVSLLDDYKPVYEDFETKLSQLEENEETSETSLTKDLGATFDYAATVFVLSQEGRSEDILELTDKFLRDHYPDSYFTENVLEQ